MNRKELEETIFQTYGISPDYPWASTPQHAVFRHPDNRKWFALVMNIPRRLLGLAGEGTIDVVNLKCDPLLIGSLRAEAGFFPAYHMNKDRWITAALDTSADDDKLRFLLSLSFDATKSV